MRKLSQQMVRQLKSYESQGQIPPWDHMGNMNASKWKKLQWLMCICLELNLGAEGKEAQPIFLVLAYPIV